jgi:hypothetical protein
MDNLKGHWEEKYLNLCSEVGALRGDNADLRTQLAEANDEVRRWKDALNHVESGDPFGLLDAYDKIHLASAFSDVLYDLRQVICTYASLQRDYEALCEAAEEALPVLVRFLGALDDRETNLRTALARRKR